MEIFFKKQSVSILSILDHSRSFFAYPFIIFGVYLSFKMIISKLYPI